MAQYALALKPTSELVRYAADVRRALREHGISIHARLQLHATVLAPRELSLNEFANLRLHVQKQVRTERLSGVSVAAGLLQCFPRRPNAHAICLYLPLEGAGVTEWCARTTALLRGNLPARERDATSLHLAVAGVPLRDATRAKYLCTQGLLAPPAESQFLTQGVWSRREARGGSWEEIETFSICPREVQVIRKRVAA